MGKALIVSAGNNANEYLARHIGELGYTRPTIVASGGEARRRMNTNDYEVIIINTPLPDEFGHELGTDAVQKTDAGVILRAKTGTAETGNGDRANAWAVGFAPADSPRIAFAVLVEGDDNDPTPHGGDVAGPIARALLEAGLQ